MEHDRTAIIVAERSAVVLLPLNGGGTLRVELDPYSSAMEAVTALAMQIGPDARVFPNRAGGEIVSFTVEVSGSPR